MAPGSKVRYHGEEVVVLELGVMIGHTILQAGMLVLVALLPSFKSSSFCQGVGRLRA